MPDDKVIRFEDGLPGFPQAKEFTLLDLEEWKPFRYLQSVGDPPIALLVVNPFLVEPDYEFELSPADMDDIQSSSPESVAVYAVATVPDDPKDATVNLLAPIVINEGSRCGKQVVLHESGYSVQHPLFTAASESAKTD